MNTNLKTALYLDDLRTPKVALDGYEPFSVVRNYDQFVSHIQTHGVPDLISFDHDLADEHMMDWHENQAKGNQHISYDTFKEKTGLDCIKWLCDTIMNEKENGNHVAMPAIRVHSANAVGSQNMLSYAASFCNAMDIQGDLCYMVTPFTIETKVEE